MNQLPKPFYQSDRATIYCGDCREIIPLLALPDAVITDPPYGIDYHHGAGGNGVRCGGNYQRIVGDNEPFDPTHLLSLSRVHGGSGAVTPMVFWGANYYAQKLPPGQWLTWDKSCGAAAAASFCDCEFAWASKKTPRNIYRHLWMGIIREGKNDDGTHTRLHPAQKPIALMVWCIELVRVGVGKVVLDPYMGVGTTGIACIRTGRKFIGIEIDSDYCAIAAERIAREEGAV